MGSKSPKEIKNRRKVHFFLCLIFVLLSWCCNISVFPPVMRIADWWKEHLRVCSSRGWNDEENRRHVSSRARAFPENLLFLLSQPSPMHIAFSKRTREFLPLFGRSFFVCFLDYYWGILVGFTNRVPNTLASCWYIVCYKLICEGCESKKCKISVVRACCANAREGFRCWSLLLEVGI